MGILYEKYLQYISKYELLFERIPNFIFKNILFHSDPNEISNFQKNFGLLLSESIHLHSNYKDNYIQLVEFASIISFMDERYLDNRNIISFIFLLHFKNNELFELKPIYQEILDHFSGIINNSMVYLSFIENFLQNISLEIVFKTFIPFLSENISTHDFIQGLFYTYGNYIGKNINLGFIKKNLHKSNRDLLLNRKGSNSEIYTGSMILNYFVVNQYNNLNLGIYYVNIILANGIDQNKFIKKIIHKIPYVNIIRKEGYDLFLYSILPRNSLNFLAKFLNSLKESGYIISYNLLEIKKANYNINYNSKISSETNILSIFPFNSKKYFSKINEKRKNSFNQKISHNSELFYANGSKLSDKIEIDSLDLFLFFNSRMLLSKLQEFKTMREFLKFIKLTIKTSEFPVLIKNYPNFSQLKKTFIHLNQDKVFQRFSSLNEIFKYYKNQSYENKNEIKLLKLIEFFGFTSTESIEKLDLEIDLFPTLADIKRNFSQVKNHSFQIIENKFISLIYNDLLRNSKIMAINSFFNSHKEVIKFFILSKYKLDWIDEVFLLFVSIKFQQVLPYRKIMHHKGIFANISSFLIISKLLLLENIDSLSILYRNFSKAFDPSMITFFNYNKQEWNLESFNLDFLINEAKKRVTRIIPSKNLHLNTNFNQKCSIKSKFNYNYLFKNLNYFNQLNSFSKTLGLNRTKIQSIFKKIFLNRCVLNNNIYSSIVGKFSNDLNEITQYYFSDLKIYPPISKMKRIFIFIKPPNRGINPLIFQKDELLKGLLMLGLENCYYFGGNENGFLILEYYLPEQIYYDQNSNFQRLIKNIKLKFQISLHSHELTEERRFFNEHALYPLDWRYQNYLLLKKVKKKDAEFFVNPHEIHYDYSFHTLSEDLKAMLKKYQTNQDLSETEVQLLFNNNILYQPRFFKWEFWQIIGYPFTMCLIIEDSQTREKEIRALVEQLPTGQILYTKNSQNDAQKLVIFLHLRENVQILYDKLYSILESYHLDFYITPIIPYDIYYEKDISKLLNISRKQPFFLAKNNQDYLEIPLFLPKKRYQTYSMAEQICMYEVIENLYPKIRSKLTTVIWLDFKKICGELQEKKQLNEETLHHRVSKLFKC
ncbi:hypothetical protein NEF87_002599 [Candidatus Lokiarchaeum ossiferum]|uniref:Uncharacterized protein n=1 Tax=Candidatus Lokiarchaeum ossiferum TaxID=2951803 RepID=A0ABY6HS30_9ARCH|nr:hypothetical protein NEF87_002599 [Candidatus Lokiarchaeum sp. B-35]